MAMNEKRKGIRALRSALFANGRRGKRAGSALYSTRDGGRVAKIGGCYSTPFKT